jgi:hypothetical protein
MYSIWPPLMRPRSSGIGLVRQAELDAAGARQHAVQLRRGGGAGQDADGELLAAPVCGLDARGQRLGHGLGIAGTGEATHAHGHAGLDQGSSLLSRHEPGGQAGVGNALVHDAGGPTSGGTSRF